MTDKFWEGGIKGNRSVKPLAFWSTIFDDKLHSDDRNEEYLINQWVSVSILVFSSFDEIVKNLTFHCENYSHSEVFAF